MIVSFAATNHRSLRERSEVSFVAESKPTTTDRAVLEVPGFDIALVPVVGLFGPNGAGKSNVLDAFADITRAIVNSHNRWEPDEPPRRDPFVGRDGDVSDPSIYEITFVFDGSVYEYSMEIGPRHIESERLLVAANGPRSWTTLFERTAGADGTPIIKTGRRLKGARAAAEAATRPNSLFLSSAAQSNQETLLPVWRWIRRGYRSATLDNRDGRGRYTAERLAGGDAEYKERLRQFVASADLGIADIKATHESLAEEDLSRLKQLVSALGDDIPLDADRLGTFVRTEFTHRGEVGALSLENESAGTRAWFEWAAPVIDALDSSQVLSADELDSYLNAHLVAKIVDAFQSPRTNAGGAQLIFSGQNAATITLSGLARDQVWIVEKSSSGDSTVVPVTDYSVRREWEIGAALSHGRFGGLPIPDDEALALAIGGQ